MKTQVAIYVKNEGLFSRSQSFLWIINIFKKMSVNVFIDQKEGVPQRLKASKEPYYIDFTPGQHYMIFTDPRAKSKKAMKAVSGAILGAAAHGAAGGSMISGAVSGYDSFNNTAIREGVIEFNLQEGDLLKISVQPKNNGSVKIKILKDK